MKVGDALLIGLILIIAAGLVFFFRSDDGGEGKYAQISADAGGERIVSSYSLNEDKVIKFESFGYHFTAEIAEGKIFIAETECPDGICAKTPAISSERETIICAPAKMMITIISEAKSGSASRGTADTKDEDYVAY
jgi:hypothetical protein